MMQNKYLFGITGGSGSGKSTVSDMLRSMGCEVIDCDMVAREVTQKGKPCLAELEAEFGSGIIAPDGSLLRRRLGDLVFKDPQKLRRLNEITHRHIITEVLRKAENSHKELVGIDGAVLFESGITEKCRAVIGVIADKEARVNRIMARDGITAESALNRINSQKKDEFYIEKCSVILYNNGNTHDLEERVREVVLKLEKGKDEQKNGLE